MIQTEVTNDSANQYTKSALPSRLRFWWRQSYNLRAQGVAKATIDTFLQTKSLTTAEITDILSNIAN